MAKDKLPPGVGGFPLGNRDRSKRGLGRSGGKKKGCSLVVLVLLAGTSAALWLGWEVVQALTG